MINFRLWVTLSNCSKKTTWVPKIEGKISKLTKLIIDFVLSLGCLNFENLHFPQRIGNIFCLPLVITEVTWCHCDIYRSTCQPISHLLSSILIDRQIYLQLCQDILNYLFFHSPWRNVADVKKRRKCFEKNAIKTQILVL